MTNFCCRNFYVIVLRAQPSDLIVSNGIFNSKWSYDKMRENIWLSVRMYGPRVLVLGPYALTSLKPNVFLSGPPTQLVSTYYCLPSFPYKSISFLTLPSYPFGCIIGFVKNMVNPWYDKNIYHKKKLGKQ